MHPVYRLSPVRWTESSGLGAAARGLDTIQAVEKTVSIWISDNDAWGFSLTFYDVVLGTDVVPTQRALK